MELEKILKVAVRGGASDIILKVGALPRFRFNGELVSLSDGLVMTTELIDSWISEIMPQHLKERFKTTGDADFSFQSTSGNRFRVNAFKQRQKPGLVLRIISNHIRTIEELQLPAVLRSLAELRRGLVLVTGATGSGKTTTLAAMIQKINTDRSAHIITIEDPIEFSFKDERSTINQREIGTDSESFGAALRGALRQNPDVILVGELRDRETTETALMAAETGHLVLSTLHTIDAIEALNRIMGYFPPHQHASLRQLLAQTLKAVISQRLVQKKDGKGMVAANEVMVINAHIKDIMTKSEHFTGLYQAVASGGDTYGMQTFDDSLIELYEAGIISKEETLTQASKRDDMQLRLRGVGN
jgi:twitching motility protein PilT